MRVWDVTAAAVFRGLGTGFFVLGLLGLAHAKAHPEARGRYHAYAGIFCGVIFGFGWPVLYFSGMLDKLGQLIQSLF